MAGNGRMIEDHSEKDIRMCVTQTRELRYDSGDVNVNVKGLVRERWRSHQKFTLRKRLENFAGRFVELLPKNAKS